MSRLLPEHIKYIVIHCSDTPDDKEFTAEDIHDWHLERGWSGIGYHSVIKRDGTTQDGRPLYWEGAHVAWQNHASIGVCLIGREKFTGEQWDSLSKEVHYLLGKFPKAKVVGHRDLDSKKTCPNFNVKEWWYGKGN